MESIQSSLFGTAEILTMQKQRRIKRVVREDINEDHINEIIRSNMKIFEDHPLNYHITAVREIICLKGFTLQEMADVLSHFLDIPDDIRTIFRVLHKNDVIAMRRNYAEALIDKPDFDLMPPEETDDEDIEPNEEELERIERRAKYD